MVQVQEPTPKHSPQMSYAPTAAPQLNSFASTAKFSYPPPMPRNMGTEDYMAQPSRALYSPKSSPPSSYMHASGGSYYNSAQVIVERYPCDCCNKSFSRPSSLRIHKHSHTGERPFVCSVRGCERAFSVRSNMRRHMKVHQPE